MVCVCVCVWWMQTVRGIDAWNGYHWTLARQMTQDGESVS